MGPGRTVRIGVHPYNLSLLVLKLRGTLPGQLAAIGRDVEWVEFEDGRCTIDLIGDDTIDLGGSGSVPPILAQAERLPVVYVAASAPRPRHGVLVTRRGSGITGVADLAGRSVALMDGSFHTDVLARALDEVGLSYRGIDVVDGLVDEGMDRFLAGEVDAWLGNDPYLDAVRSALGADLVDVLESGALTTNRSIWYAAAGFVEREPAVLDAVLSALRESDREIAADPAAAAVLLAAAGVGDADATAWETTLRNRSWQVLPVTAEIVAEQQDAADRYLRHRIIDRAITVAEAVAPTAASLRAVGHAPAGTV